LMAAGWHATAVNPWPSVKVRQEREVEIDVVPRVKPGIWINPVTCVGTAGFEPATP
jgi:hypothetical protein